MWRFGLLFLFLISQHSFAQSFRSGKWGIEANYQLGTFIKHSPKIIRVPHELSHGFELVGFKKTLGEQNWQKPLNFPEIGGSFSYFHFGDNKIFGDAYLIMAIAKFYAFRTKYVNGYVRIGGGFAALTKHYDYLTNPENNIVSSTINMAAQFRIGLEWKASPYSVINTAFTFSHFSNSSIKLPNFGINMAIATVGIKVFPQLKTLEYNCEKMKPLKKNEVIIKYSLGLQQAYGQNGPAYPVHVATILYSRYTSTANKVFGGFSFEYARAVHDFIVVQELDTKKNAKLKAFFPSIYVGDELMVGKVGMFLGLGVYVIKNNFVTSPIYIKAGGNYYFAETGKRKGIKFFVGTNVKSHLQVAQYWEFSTGACF